MKLPQPGHRWAFGRMPRGTRLCNVATSRAARLQISVKVVILCHGVCPLAARRRLIRLPCVVAPLPVS